MMTPFQMSINLLVISVLTSILLSVIVISFFEKFNKKTYNQTSYALAFVAFLTLTLGASSSFHESHFKKINMVKKATIEYVTKKMNIPKSEDVSIDFLGQHSVKVSAYNKNTGNLTTYNATYRIWKGLVVFGELETTSFETYKPKVNIEKPQKNWIK